MILAEAAGAPPVPASLKRAGRDEWLRVWTAGRAWLAPGIDVFILERYCQQHDRLAEMYARVERDGMIVEGYKGQPRPHPLLSEIRALESEMRKVETELGFTPAARSKLGHAEVRRVSKMDELVARRRKASGGQGDGRIAGNRLW